MKRFDQCVSVITGAGSGIGESTAIRLANEGSNVILVGRTKEKLQHVADQINSDHNKLIAVVHPTDVTNEEQVQQLQEFVKSRYGELHVLVNNAGSSGTSSILDLNPSEWERVQDVNVKSVFLVSKMLGEIMIDASTRSPIDRAIVNIASLSGHKAGAKIPHYSASKAAVINFSKALALEFATYNIRVNSVSPGFIETPLTEEGLNNSRFEDAIKRNTALGRVGRPEEIANIIAFLASPESSYMTGTDVLADGGWLIK